MHVPLAFAVSVVFWFLFFVVWAIYITAKIEAAQD